jgi:hypothetical protein
LQVGADGEDSDVWYSPLTEKLRSKPAFARGDGPRGGFICEEMGEYLLRFFSVWMVNALNFISLVTPLYYSLVGMGKTIITLAMILSNPIPDKDELTEVT